MKCLFKQLALGCLQRQHPPGLFPCPPLPHVLQYAVDIDLAKDAIKALKAKNSAIKVVCYFSAGSWEDYRCADGLLMVGAQLACECSTRGQEDGRWRCCRSNQATMLAACVPTLLSARFFTPCRLDDDQAKRGIKPTDWGSSLGRKMDGWPGERWVDVRQQAVRTIMQKRLKYCADIKCDGVDPGVLG